MNTLHELMGYKTLAMMLRYSHLSPNHKAEAVKLLDTFWTGFSRATSDRKRLLCPGGGRNLMISALRLELDAPKLRNWQPFDWTQDGGELVEPGPEQCRGNATDLKSLLAGRQKFTPSVSEE